MPTIIALTPHLLCYRYNDNYKSALNRNNCQNIVISGKRF